MAKNYSRNKQSLSRALKRGNKIIIKSVFSKTGVNIVSPPHHNKSEFMKKHKMDRALEFEKMMKENVTPPIKSDPPENSSIKEIE